MTLAKIAIWFVRVGPCWCTGRPEGTSSRDLERLRRTQVRATGLLDRDVVISPRSVTPAIRPQLEELLDRPDVIGIAYPLCPRAAEAMPVDLVPAFALTRPAIELEDCVSGYPEVLVAALLEYLDLPERAGHRTRLAEVMGY